MRKTSHDGGDSTSISGFENETRKTSVGLIKTKRNSIKRKVQNFSHESDDTVIEPLLQIDKTETINRSAKYLLSKSKTDSSYERENNTCDNKFEKHSGSKPTINTTGIITSNNTNITIHNHMNTNVFGGHDGSQVSSTVKCPILVEISGGKTSGNLNQSSSIFTTAKIHADSITKTMTPMQVTPLPILSTAEGNIVKAGISPDFSQSKNVVTSNGSNLTNSINSFSRSNITSTDSILKNISALDSRPLETTTKFESKLLNQSYDTQKFSVTSVTGTKDTEAGNKIILQPKSSINTISEKNSKSLQEQRDLGFAVSFRPRDTETKIEIINNINLPNQSISSAQTVVPKEFGVAKKEDKNVSSSGGSMKQLQRQKNAIVEDSKDADILKNVNKDDKSPTSKHTSIDKVTQSTEVKDSLIGKEMITNITTSVPLVSNTSKEISSKSFNQPTQSESQLDKADLKNGKKISEKQMDKFGVNNNINTTVSAKETTSKSTVSIPITTSQIPSTKSDISKDYKGSTNGRQKSVKDNETVSTFNKTISKPAVTIQSTQATSTAKSDFINKDHDAGSSCVERSSKESSVVIPSVTKHNVEKLSSIAQPSLSLTKLKSDAVKGKTPETDNFTTDRISSNVVSVKSPITTNPLSKVNSTKVLATTSTPVSKNVTTKANIISSDKSMIGSQQQNIIKAKTASIPSLKAINTNSFSPTTTVTKSNISKVPPSVATQTNSAQASTKTELSNKTLSTASSLTTKKSANSTLAKTSTSTNQSSKPKATEKQEKI